MRGARPSAAISSWTKGLGDYQIASFTTTPQSRPTRSSGNSRNMITQKKSPYRLITDKQLAGLRSREDALFQKRTRKSKETFDKAQEMLC